ncbi:hypothetical protein GYMLUDRAFT_637382 [Collybiopsis luxurians FD-317 M1]|nr:hypothetical protein GYMLUDRAFT_637382 [Collybiopsis luxurians FD-317 M1]
MLRARCNLLRIYLIKRACYQLSGRTTAYNEDTSCPLSEHPHYSFTSHGILLRMPYMLLRFE